MAGRNVSMQQRLARVLDTALDKGLAAQRPVVLAYLHRARSRRPGAAPTEVIEQLDRQYLATVAGLGAAAGGSAALPGVGTATSLASGAAEITAFVSATALYVLVRAEVHGVPVANPQVRRALVLTVLLGEGGPIAVDAAARESGRWGGAFARSASKDKLAGANARLTHLLVTRFGARQGALLLGRALPLGIGAGVGAAGNAALARAAIGAAGRVFGPPPLHFAPAALDGGSAPGRPRDGAAEQDRQA
jgi:hypothetical protein